MQREGHRLTWLAVLSVSSVVGAFQVQGETTTAPRSRDCLFATQPSRWAVLDQKNLVVWGPGRQAYEVSLFFPLPELPFSESLAFIDGDHNGMICGDSFDKIAIPNQPTANIPSSIESMRRVDDAQLLALAEKYQVKLLSDKQIAELKERNKKAH